jgi:acetyltransferase-like isoleucine patch superfamily enzyme
LIRGREKRNLKGPYIEFAARVNTFTLARWQTIFSINHNYSTGTQVQYDSIDIKILMVIEDFVWCGANVTILPWFTIDEGAVIGAGSVITSDVSP